VRKQFSKYCPKTCWLLTTIVYSSSAENEVTSPTNFDPGQTITAPRASNLCEVRDPTCPCVHSFSWTLFRAASWNVIENNNLAVTKFRTCILNILCSFWKIWFLRYLLLNIVFKIKLKPLISGHVFIWTYFLVLVQYEERHTWNFSTHFRYILYSRLRIRASHEK